ncbi:MAG: hypothetical protein QXH30_01675 [Candidatus Bilamarchaeaceae archaeon]
MRQINCIHIESRVPLLKERKFSRKVLPPDRRFSAAREQMKARRELAKYNRVARQVFKLYKAKEKWKKIYRIVSLPF